MHRLHCTAQPVNTVMRAQLREWSLVALAAVPLAFIFSVLMRVVAQQFQVATPGWIFVKWFLSGYAPRWLSGPASDYLILVDVGFCWVVLLLVYRLIYKRFYDVG